MTRQLPALFVASVFLVHSHAFSAPAEDSALAQLAAGGGEIDPVDAAPGLIELTGEAAFPLLKDESGKIIAAASVVGTGKEESRIVAFSHGAFLKGKTILSQSAGRDLVLNAIRWASKSDQPEVALHPDLKELAAALEEADLDVELVAPEEISRGTVRSVYVTIAQPDFDEKAVTALLECSARGAGIVVAATPWPFSDRYPNFADFPANRLAGPGGIRLRPNGTADTSKPYAVRYTDPGAVIEQLATLVRDPLPKNTSERAEAAAALRAGTSLRGDSLATFLKGLKALNERLGPIVPTTENPVIPGADPLVDAVMAIETELNRSLPAGRMYALPASSDYPGAVPADAPRIQRKLTLDGNWKGWLSGRGAAAWAAGEMRPTGLYAAPGDVITVTAPETVVGRGFEVVIGSYGGTLANRDKWERYPDLQRSVEIARPETKLSSALGGLVTIRVPRGAAVGPVEILIAGGVEAPLFVAGKSDLRAWRDHFRKAPAPWAELASDRIILALPSRYIRDLDDPDKVLKAWDEIIEKGAELCGGVDRNLYRAERIVFDRQTAAGYMHSSYPVAAPQDGSVVQAVDAEALREAGNWGFFHEYGHNHQHDLWSLPGTGETTCNLWSVYLFEEWVGKPRAEGHDAVRPLDRKQRMNAYFEGGRNFESDWSVWTALETYLQVQEKFGWEPFKKVFAEYNALPESEWPKTQQEKNDQWVIRLSRACGSNLAPFWRTWNVPLSDSVFQELSNLPEWKDHPVAKWAK